MSLKMADPSTVSDSCRESDLKSLMADMDTSVFGEGCLSEG